jgi:chromate transporter
MEKQTTKKHVLFTLFFATLYLSTFTFGGGYVIVTLLKDKFVDHYHWIDEDEILDLVAIAQSSPGAIAVNGAIVVGYKLAKIPGVLVSVLGAIIPPMVIISVVSVFYTLFVTNQYISALLTGMKAGVGAVIASVVYDMGKDVAKSKDMINIIIMIVSFCANYFLNVNVILIILAVGVFGFLRTLIQEKRRKMV